MQDGRRRVRGCCRRRCPLVERWRPGCDARADRRSDESEVASSSTLKGDAGDDGGGGGDHRRGGWNAPHARSMAVATAPAGRAAPPSEGDVEDPLPRLSLPSSELGIGVLGGPEEEAGVDADVRAEGEVDVVASVSQATAAGKLVGKGGHPTARGRGSNPRTWGSLMPLFPSAIVGILDRFGGGITLGNP